jgi:hypothetical protein
MAGARMLKAVFKRYGMLLVGLVEKVMKMQKVWQRARFSAVRSRGSNGRRYVTALEPPNIDTATCSASTDDAQQCSYSQRVEVC